MIILKGICVWIESMYIAAVSQGNSAEARAVIAVVDENVIRLNICVNYALESNSNGMQDYTH